MKVSIIVVTYDRIKQLKRCLDHLEAAALECPSLEFEYVIGVNGPDQNTQRFLREWHSTRRAKISFRPAPLLPSPARNELLSLASGDWLYFVDDDAYVHRQIFTRFAAGLRAHPGASAFGGPNLTPEESTLFQRASGAALASRFATFFSAARYRPLGTRRRSGEESLILCNLFLGRHSLGDEPFPPQFLCCEENWVLNEMETSGCVLIYDPELTVWHERRASPIAFARQVFKYGFGRGQLIRRRPRAWRAPHLLPVLALIAGAILVAAAAINRSLIPLLPLAVYAGLCLGAVTRNIRFHRAALMPGVVSGFVYPIIHVFYGLGVFFGIVGSR